MRVGYYQFRPRFGRPQENLRRVLERLDGVRADLIVLPELAFTGYLFRDRDEALALAEEPSRSPIVGALAELARRRGMHLVTGFAERSGKRCYNSALLIGPRGPLATYRKLHLFGEEKTWFDAGDLPLVVRRVGALKVGMLVCFDWVFPEAARRLALDGAELLAHPSNLVLGHCQQVMLARCLENGVFAVTANRHGEDRRPFGRLRFTGKSQVVAPGGRLLRRAPAGRDELFVCRIDPAAARDKRITPRNHLLRDRRPRFY